MMADGKVTGMEGAERRLQNRVLLCPAYCPASAPQRLHVPRTDPPVFPTFQRGMHVSKARATVRINDSHQKLADMNDLPAAAH